MTTTRAQLRWLAARLGRYPFAEYGVLATPFGGELETQTLTTMATSELQSPQEADSILLHELSHAWFGDSVSVRRWGSDLWLAEGHAVYYEDLWSDRTSPGTLLRSMRAAYRQLPTWAADEGPIAAPRPVTGADAAYAPYTISAYEGGALVLYALRERVGARTFSRIERAWVSTYRDRSAGTDEFIALASRVSGHDQRPFLTRWVYGRTPPPMPGHPDWGTAPARS